MVYKIAVKTAFSGSAYFRFAKIRDTVRFGEYGYDLARINAMRDCICTEHSCNKNVVHVT